MQTPNLGYRHNINKAEKGTGDSFYVIFNSLFIRICYDNKNDNYCCWPELHCL